MQLASLADHAAHLVLTLGNRLTAPLAKTNHFQRTFRIEKPPAEVYGFWRDFHNFKKVTRSADSIEVHGPREARWLVRGPFGVTLAWTSEVTVDDQDRCIGWRTTGQPDVPHVGQVVFQSLDGGKATELALAVDYKMPLGPIGELIAWVTRAGPSTFISEEIARVKLAIEGHRPRATNAAAKNNTIDRAKGPTNPPVVIAPKKNGQSLKLRITSARGPIVDVRQRLRTQH